MHLLELMEITGPDVRPVLIQTTHQITISEAVLFDHKVVVLD